MIPSSRNHPLLRDGQSQVHRVPPALDPASAPLDDRRVPELLVETRDVAGLVHYVSTANVREGTWTPFLDRHVAVQLALLARESAEVFRARTADSYRDLLSVDAAAQRAAVADLARVIAGDAAWFVSLFPVLAATRFAHTYARAIDGSVVLSVRSAITAAHAFLGADGPAAVAAVATERAGAFWGWSAAALRVAAAAPAPAFADVRAALVNTVNQVARVRAFLARAAGDALVDGSLDDGLQPPHLGLLLAFFRLFQHGQAALNDLVRRHLEYYYRDVVGLRPRAAQSDHAYVVVELARGADPLLLPAGTLLNAGRDAAKQDILFALARDAALHHARVDSLRSLWRDATTGWRVASAADSADGAGAPLPKDAPRWPAFGSRTLPAARLGWALATPTLRVTDGVKTVVVALRLTAEASDAFVERAKAAAGAGRIALVSHLGGVLLTVPAAIDLAFTGPEGWHVVERQALYFVPGARTLYAFTTGLEAETVLAPHDAAVHGRTYGGGAPVMEILVRPEAVPIEVFADLALERVSLTVGVRGDTRLILANDSGPLDPAKPFEPFGPRPVPVRGTSAGSRFLIGSREIFAKHLAAVSFDLEWKDMPADLGAHFGAYVDRPTFIEGFLMVGQVLTSSTTILGRREPPRAPEPTVNLAYLDGGQWKTLDGQASAVFGDAQLALPAAIGDYPATPSLVDFEAYAPDLRRGFVRLELASPSWGFGHERYPHLVATEAIRAVREGRDPVEVNAPVTPVLTRIAANYTATEDIDPAAPATAGGMQLYHIEPHGEQLVPQAPGMLLAPAPEGDAAFFIGVADFAPQATLSLLLHLADGSGDPFAAYPGVAWSYLAGDQWLAFAPEEVLFDSTLALRRTGLLTVALPAAATIRHTRMPAGRVWLRAVATGDTRALNLAYAVRPNAAEVVFRPGPLNDLTRLAAPLAAGTIKKLVVAHPAVKKIEQPLPSFGGTVAEGGARFHRRASERLRHRSRAVEPWDYERLVLEEFPALQLVKCVPHATVDSALAPGHTLVVVVPDPRGGEMLHPLRPAATQDVLAGVRDFLRTRCSGLARIEVVNPLYEEVQVVARVQLRAGHDVGLHATLLAEEVRSYLAPWVAGRTEGLRFTGEIHPSQILNFVEERPYVDFVTDFAVRQWAGAAPLSPDPAVLRGTTARSILTSHPSHLLTVA